MTATHTITIGNRNGATYQVDARRPLLETLREQDPEKLTPPLHGALLKNEQDVHLLEQDVHLLERLAFMHRRESR